MTAQEFIRQELFDPLELANPWSELNLREKYRKKVELGMDVEVGGRVGVMLMRQGGYVGLLGLDGERSVHRAKDCRPFIVLGL